MISGRTVRVERADGVVTITVDRPSALNALSRQVLTELADAFTDLDAAGSTGVILTGAGGRAFIAGADISEMLDMTPDEGAAFGALGQRVTELIEAAPVPVIAAVHGYALGGGCEMALACDFRYASADAVFGQPEVALGLIPGYGATVRLPRLVGPGIARELLFTGRRIDAAEALRIGLVNAVFDTRDALLAAARATLDEIARQSPEAVAIAKSTLRAVDGVPTPAALEIERAGFRRAFTTDDMREGTRAFLDKRRPDFAGRRSNTGPAARES
ncbi:MAG: enoyl-CoA hydratase/isomerase family protein [Mycobacteriales bacterium]